MIFKITYDDERIEFCTAKDQLHLLKSYDLTHELCLQEIESIEELTDDQAKKIMVFNTDYDELDPESEPKEVSLFSLHVNDDFGFIAGSEFE